MIQSILDFITSLFGFTRPSRKLKTDGQQVFAGFLAYHWSDQSSSSLRSFIDSCVKNHFTGVSIELIELMAAWPRGEKVSDLDKALKEKVIKLAPLVKECRRAGLWLRIILNNSNADINKKLTSPSSFNNTIDLIKSTYGQSNILVLPVSEEDGDLASNIRSAIIQHVEAVWDNDKTIAYRVRRPNCKWVETHIGHVSSPITGAWSVIAVSDTGHILMELNTDGVMGTTPNIPQWVKFVKSNLKGGVSVCCYAFHKVPNYNLLDQVGQAIVSGSVNS